MTKRHFNAIAKLIEELHSYADPAGKATIITVAVNLSELFAQFNPRFCQTRFLEACGLPAELEDH